MAYLIYIRDACAVAWLLDRDIKLYPVWIMKINKDTLLTWGIFASFTDDKNAQENGYHGNADQYELVLPSEIQEKIYDLINEHLEKAETIELPNDLPYIFE
jgi:hypothetical protein